MGWAGALRAGLCLLAWIPLEAKLQVAQLHLGGVQRWGFMSKFGYAPGNGTYRLRVRVPSQTRRPDGNITLRFESYLDEDWNEVLSIEDPCLRTRKTRKTWNLNVPSNGQWSDPWNGQVRNTVRSHVWYFVLLHCGEKLKDHSVRFEYEIRHLNEGDSHFTIEKQWTLPANVLSLLCFLAFSILFARRCISEMRGVGKLHPVIQGLVAVVGLELLAQSLHALHLLRYGYDGKGLRLLEIVAELLFVLSQLVQSTLLLLIGYGYTLLPVDIAPDMVVLAFGIGAVLHIVLVLLIKGEDDADKFHDYESLAGKILLALRLMLFVGFLWALNGTMQGAPFRIRRFLAKFGFIGTLYFVGPPMVVLLVSFFAPYWRPPILTSCLMLLQILDSSRSLEIGRVLFILQPSFQKQHGPRISTAWWLNHLFLSRGEFFEVSELNSSSLPGGTPRSKSPRSSPRYDRDKHD